MGQKVNPHGLRVGVIKDWDSKWYAEESFADYLVEDHEIRTFLKKKLYSAGVSKIEIERASDRVKITIHTAKPGVVIGKGGAEIEKVKKELQKFTNKKLVVDIKEIKRPDKDAQLVAENIALQLENRIFSSPQSAGTLRSESEIRGTLRFLPQLEMRPSSNVPNPVESREAPPTSSFPDFSEPP